MRPRPNMFPQAAVLPILLLVSEVCQPIDVERVCMWVRVRSIPRAGLHDDAAHAAAAGLLLLLLLR